MKIYNDVLNVIILNTKAKKNFIEISELQKLINNFNEMTCDLAKEVEKEKMKVSWEIRFGKNYLILLFTEFVYIKTFINCYIDVYINYNFITKKFYKILVVHFDNQLSFFKQAIGSRNLLKSIAKKRETQKQQLLVLIGEKKSELERWKVLVCHKLYLLNYFAVKQICHLYGLVEKFLIPK